MWFHGKQEPSPMPRCRRLYGQNVRHHRAELAVLTPRCVRNVALPAAIRRLDACYPTLSLNCPAVPIERILFSDTGDNAPIILLRRKIWQLSNGGRMRIAGWRPDLPASLGGQNSVIASSGMLSRAVRQQVL